MALPLMLDDVREPGHGRSSISRRKQNFIAHVAAGLF
jgi:hypothetical protein